MERENACVAAAGWRDDNRLGAPEVCCVLMDLGGVMERENACVAAAGWRDDNRLGAPEVCCALMDLGGVMERENACVESGRRDDKRPELTADAR